VDDVGEGVPVRDVLGVFRTHDNAMPKLDGAAFANRLTAHEQQDDSDS
jgi:hypothetical protein